MILKKKVHYCDFGWNVKVFGLSATTIVAVLATFVCNFQCQETQTMAAIQNIVYNCHLYISRNQVLHNLSSNYQILCNYNSHE